MMIMVWPALRISAISLDFDSIAGLCSYMLVSYVSHTNFILCVIVMHSIHELYMYSTTQ